MSINVPGPASPYARTFISLVKGPNIVSAKIVSPDPVGLDVGANLVIFSSPYRFIIDDKTPILETLDNP